MNVNILTFNGPQVAEPLQRRAPDWEKPDRRPRQRRRGRVPDHLRQGAARRVDRHQRVRCVRLQPAVAGRLRRPGLPARPDRSREQRPAARLAGHRPVLPRLQRELQRQGLHDPARRRLPHGLLPEGHPRQGRRQAAGHVGRLPRRRRRSTTARTSTATASRTTARASRRRRAPRATGGSSRSPAACSRARAPTRARSSTPTDMNPLFGPNEAMTKALETYAKTAEFGPPDELNHGRRRHPRPVHDRALRPDDGLGRHRHPDPRHLRRRTRPARRSRPAGSRSSTAPPASSSPCDATTCPNAVDGVNYAPFASFGGWSGAVNAKSPEGEPGRRVRLPVVHELTRDLRRGRDARQDRLQPVPDVPLQRTSSRGSTPASARPPPTNYLGAIKASLENTNMVLDLRIPLTKRYEQDVLDTAVSQYLAKELDAAGTEQAIADGWNAITDEAGKDQAARCLCRQPWRPAIDSLELEPGSRSPRDRLSAAGPRAGRPTRSARGVPTARPDGCSSGRPSSSSSSSRSSRSSRRSPCRSRGSRSTRAASTSSSSASRTTSSSSSASSGPTSSAS